MPRTLTASDRRSLIRLASTLPVGSPERKAILNGLKAASRNWRNLEQRLSRAYGWEASQPGEYTIFLSEPDAEGGVDDGDYVIVGVRDLRGSDDMIEVADYGDRRQSVPKDLIQKALKTRELDFDF